MKKIMIMSIFIIIFLLIGNVNATDTYKIKDVRNLETSIPMQNEPTNVYIDYRNMDEADSGGYIQGENRFVLPHDLGLGKHKMEIETKDGITEYDFYIIKDSEDINIYDGYSPYYYDDINESDESVVEEDYQIQDNTDNIAKINPYQKIINTKITKQNIISQDQRLTHINVNLGNHLIINNDKLTSIKY